MTAVDFTRSLDGEEAARARELAHALGELLRDASPTGDPGLATGDSGIAVALAYLDGAFPGEGFGAAAHAALRTAVRAISSGRIGPSLMQGFTGVAWATAHLARREGESADAAVAAIDRVLTELLERGAWRAGFDVVSGVCGVGVYAIERGSGPAPRRLLELVVEELGRLSTRTEDGVTWLARPEHLHDETRARAPEGMFDAGLAHGVPGPVGVLGAALGAGIEPARPLLDGAVAWLESVARDDVSLLPYGVGGSIEPAPARLAWCYGDPGAAAALRIAGRAGHAAAGELADRAVARIAARDDATSGVQGASLCHGTAGLAHLAGRLGLPDVAARWVAATHAMRSPEKGPGGFLEIAVADPARPPGEVQGLGWLGGIAGVALAMLAAAGGEEPAWDRALLVSPPPEPAA